MKQFYPAPVAEMRLIQALSSFTKIPKKELVKKNLDVRKTGEQLPIYVIDVLGERFRGFNPMFYSVVLAQNSLNLLQLVSPSGWLKCPIREAYFQGKEYLMGEYKPVSHNYLLTVSLTGMTWAVSHLPAYATPNPFSNFAGTMLVRDLKEGGVFVAQPIKNYLAECLGFPEGTPLEE